MIAITFRYSLSEIIFGKMHPNQVNILRQATEVAATFFGHFISSRVEELKRRQFVVCFQQLLTSRFERHWYPENPNRGQAYRCIRLNPSNNKEPLIETAVIVAGLTYNDIQLPLELTVWIDPDKVAYRFGENDGSHCTLISFKEQSESNNKTAATPLRPYSNKEIPRMHVMDCKGGHKFCYRPLRTPQLVWLHRSCHCQQHWSFAQSRRCFVSHQCLSDGAVRCLFFLFSSHLVHILCRTSSHLDTTLKNCLKLLFSRSL